MNKPRSAYDKAGGMTYFPRMLDKIRLFADDQLHPDFHANLGKGADGWCCDFLRIPYPDLRLRVLAGGTDEQVLEWCFANGRRLTDDVIDITVQAAAGILTGAKVSTLGVRSEERRVGKECCLVCRSRWSPYH